MQTPMRSGDHRETTLTLDFLKPGWEKFHDLAREGNGGKMGCGAVDTGGLKREGGRCGVGLGSEAQSVAARLGSTCEPPALLPPPWKGGMERKGPMASPDFAL